MENIVLNVFADLQKVFGVYVKFRDIGDDLSSTEIHAEACLAAILKIVGISTVRKELVV